jgi:hypothetical protein
MSDLLAGFLLGVAAGLLAAVLIIFAAARAVDAAPRSRP